MDHVAQVDHRSLFKLVRNITDAMERAKIDPRLRNSSELGQHLLLQALPSRLGMHAKLSAMGILAR